MARSDGSVSNFDEQPNLAISFASTKGNPAPDLLDVYNIEAVFEELSDWQDQLKNVNFDDLEPPL